MTADRLTRMACTNGLYCRVEVFAAGKEGRCPACMTKGEVIR